MIDINYIFQLELNKDRPREKWRDADRYSKELRETHLKLWDKPLPNGERFTLEKIVANRLRHKSKLGEFILSSDRAVPTFFKKSSLRNRRAYSYLVDLPHDMTQSFWNLSETIGGIVIWPAVKNGGNTINQNRCFGANRFIIADRLDLTLECIRRYYKNIDNPLTETFIRYNSFFCLFENFRGYVDFFLFQDWVDKDYATVYIAPPFDNFRSPAIPKTELEYRAHRCIIMDLVEKRNRRIDRLYNP